MCLGSKGSKSQLGSQCCVSTVWYGVHLVVPCNYMVVLTSKQYPWYGVVHHVVHYIHCMVWYTISMVWCGTMWYSDHPGLALRIASLPHPTHSTRGMVGYGRVRYSREGYGVVWCCRLGMVFQSTHGQCTADTVSHRPSFQKCTSAFPKIQLVWPTSRLNVYVETDRS